ncbi:hypothetical protein L7F22_053477 [Adiantum nelumboides]|nr:hypothetical protein [Adiantum nelumboides]
MKQIITKYAHKREMDVTNESAKEDKAKDELADDILKKRDTLIAATFTSVLEISPHDEAQFASFLRKANIPDLLLNGDESNTITSLLFAGCLVEKISMDVVPVWNELSQKQSKKFATLASLFVADNGCLGSLKLVSSQVCWKLISSQLRTDLIFGTVHNFGYCSGYWLVDSFGK